jgi:cyclopropane fatty-acyl-phospholipid synthase-like methyltransferase
MSDDLAIPDLGGHRLEIGCGSRARAAKGARRTYVGVDAHEPYLAEAHKRYPSRIFMLADWRTALEMFEANSFDAVYAIDFLEHLAKREGRAFIHEAERVAPAVAIFAPVGRMPQTPRQGMLNGDPRYQRHRSAWTPADFDGWEIEVFRRFHRQLRDGTALVEPLDAFWAIKR